MSKPNYNVINEADQNTEGN